jgi:hypothetical protein
MAIGKISGVMLQANLVRQGTNLSVDATAYFDVNNYRLGVNNSSPQYTLDVNGNAHVGNLFVLGNTISSNTGKIDLGYIANLVVRGGQVNNVVYTDGSGNLAFGNLDTLSGLEGFTANYITLGSNTVGSLGNAIAISTTSTVTDAIALLDQLLGNITNSTGSVIHVLGNITAGNVTANLYGPTIDAINANITAANAAIVTANTAVVSYVNTLNSAMSANVIAANAAIVTANTAVVSYVNTLTNSLATGANANTAAYLTTYTGNINASNFTGNLYGNIYTDIISPYKTTVTTFNSSTAIRLPIGGNVGRPSSPTAGQIRYNSDYNSVEFYNGSTWVNVITNIAGQNFYGNATIGAGPYTLNQSTTTNGVLVSINGTVQQPVYAYNVTGNQITFTEIPLVTDQIDVRFLAASVTVDNIFNTDVSVTGNITLTGILSSPLTTKTSTSTGTAGQVAWDANYIYVCTSANTWKRVALTGGVF